jgi:Transposase DNA-binding/Transposase Tn5 dimerisation domain
MHKISVKDFPGLDLGDIRRNERFVAIIENITARPGSSIPKQNESWYDTKATYEFFKNEQIKIDSLHHVIEQYGVGRLKNTEEILIIHDTSNISFNELQAEGLGYLDSKLGRGIMCHSSIAVSTEGLPLSLIHQHTWTRPPENLEVSEKVKQKRKFEDKESYRWYRGITQVNQLLNAEIKKIHIADREADIYELFFCAYEPGTELLIRSHYDRSLSDGSHLWQTVAATQAKGEIILSIPDAKGKKSIPVTAAVRYQPVEILRPSTSKAKYESVELTAIEIKQTDSNSNDAIHWKLLTTLEVKDLNDVLKYIKWYTYRWLIERFHYVLKSGTKIEELQLKQASSLQKAIALYSIAGFRIMQMVYESRIYPGVNCELVLTEPQWKVLYMLVHHTNNIPQKPPTLSEAVMWIGRLGGHPGRKSDGPPGLKTVWLGYQRICDAANVYELLQKQNLGKG